MTWIRQLFVRLLPCPWQLRTAYENVRIECKVCISRNTYLNFTEWEILKRKSETKLAEWKIGGKTLIKLDKDNDKTEENSKEIRIRRIRIKVIKKIIPKKIIQKVVMPIASNSNMTNKTDKINLNRDPKTIIIIEIRTQLVNYWLRIISHYEIYSHSKLTHDSQAL